MHSVLENGTLQSSLHVEALQTCRLVQGDVLRLCVGECHVKNGGYLFTAVVSSYRLSLSLILSLSPESAYGLSLVCYGPARLGGTGL